MLITPEAESMVMVGLLAGRVEADALDHTLRWLKVAPEAAGWPWALAHMERKTGSRVKSTDFIGFKNSVYRVLHG